MVALVVRGRSLIFPATPVALGDLLHRFQLFVILVDHTYGSTDLGADVLIGRGIVSSGRLVADRRRGNLICVKVARDHRLSVCLHAFQLMLAATSRGARSSLKVKRRRDS